MTENNSKAYCILCGAPTNHDLENPFCATCGCSCSSTCRTSQIEMLPIFCHSCGKTANITLEDPICEECKSKNNS
ncbi:MAG: hypothetical protein ACTSVI_06555 [Promethearchaeota archaeon]